MQTSATDARGKHSNVNGPLLTRWYGCSPPSTKGVHANSKLYYTHSNEEWMMMAIRHVIE